MPKYTCNYRSKVILEEAINVNMVGSFGSKITYYSSILILESE